MNNLDLVYFPEALEKNTEAQAKIAQNTYYRYMRGDLPDTMRWLMRHPDLLAALIRDADRLKAAKGEAGIPDRDA